MVVFVVNTTVKSTCMLWWTVYSEACCGTNLVLSWRGQVVDEEFSLRNVFPRISLLIFAL